MKVKSYINEDMLAHAWRPPSLSNMLVEILTKMEKSFFKVEYWYTSYFTQNRKELVKASKDKISQRKSLFTWESFNF